MSIRSRVTRSHTRNRRSHHALSEPRLSTCPDCSAAHLRHSACSACGKYRGRVVVDVAAKLAKKEKKLKEREKEAIRTGQTPKGQADERTAETEEVETPRLDAENLSKK